MASGRFGKANLIEETWTKLYAVPDGKVITANIRVVNRTVGDIAVRIAVSVSDATPPSINLNEYIEYDVLVPGHGILEDTGIVCSEGELIWVWASDAGLTVRVHGYEENI